MSDELIRNEIIEAMARTAFCVAWADNQEELAQRGLPHENLSGCEIFDVAPITPDYAREYAQRVAKKIEGNNFPLAEMFGMALSRGYEKDEKDFGYLLMMSAQGQGVGWNIEPNDPHFDIPYVDGLMYEGDDAAPFEEEEEGDDE